MRPGIRFSFSTHPLGSSPTVRRKGPLTPRQQSGPTIIVGNGDVVAAINARFQTVQRVPLGTVLEARIDDFY